MPLPRQVLPGRTYMITRRCTQRQFLLRPDSATNNAFIYCLAVAVQHSGVRAIFTAAESNHHHTGIYDPSVHRSQVDFFRSVVPLSQVDFSKQLSRSPPFPAPRSVVPLSQVDFSKQLSDPLADRSACHSRARSCRAAPT